MILSTLFAAAHIHCLSTMTHCCLLFACALAAAAVGLAFTYAEGKYIKTTGNTFAGEDYASSHGKVITHGTKHKPAMGQVKSIACVGECKKPDNVRKLLAAKKPTEHQLAKKDWHNPPKMDWHKPAPAKQCESMCPAQHLDCGCLLHFSG
jgi:hypothetical protein